MNKIWEIIKKIWQVIIAVLIWFSLCLIIYIQPGIQISDKIQALAIITLVFITLFYARQTQKLVEQEKISLEEERKKRCAEFGEERLKKFYNPLFDYLSNMSVMIPFSIHIEVKKLQEISNNIRKLYIENVYMSSEKLEQSIIEFVGKLDEVENGIKRKRLEEKTKNEALKKLQELKKILLHEYREIENNIKKVYGYFIENGEK